VTYKHVGIMAVSYEGAALGYREFCAESERRLGGHHHPEVSMHTNDLGMLMELTALDRWDEIAEWMCVSADKLASIGAEVLICPDNTVHQSIDLIRDRLPLPFLHIADVVADEAQRRGYRSVGLTGTRWLMEGPVYPARFAARGIGCVVPSEEQRIRIHGIITSELVYGIVTDPSLQYLQSVVRDLAREGCDAVALSCTELPLALNDGNSPLPVLDSTRLLARAAVDYAMGQTDAAGGTAA
jgi:aspartate racemase